MIIWLCENACIYALGVQRVKYEVHVQYTVHAVNLFFICSCDCNNPFSNTCSFVAHAIAVKQ